jgi:lambda family phage tail tape measure protein
MEENAAALASAQQLAKQEQALNDEKHKAGVMSDQAYYDEKRRIATEAAQKEIAALTQDINILDTKKVRDDVDRNNTEKQIRQIENKIALKESELAFEKTLAEVQQARTADQAAYNAELANEKQIKSALKTDTTQIKTRVKNGTTSEWDGLKQSDAAYQTAVDKLTATRDSLAQLASPYDDKAQAKVAAMTEEITRLDEMTGQYKATVDKFGENALGTFFADTLMRTKSLGDAFKDMTLTFISQLIRMESAAAASNVMKSMGGLSGIIGAFTGVASANGNVFSGGQVVHAFANGGAFTNSVVSQPTVAPMALFGEKGDEAIMPLARGSDGKLGVQASGGGGAPSFVFQNTYHVAADADKAYVQHMVEAGNRRTQAAIDDKIKRNRNAFGRG